MRPREILIFANITENNNTRNCIVNKILIGRNCGPTISDYHGMCVCVCVCIIVSIMCFMFNYKLNYNITVSFISPYGRLIFNFIRRKRARARDKNDGEIYDVFMNLYRMLKLFSR